MKKLLLVILTLGLLVACSQADETGGSGTTEIKDSKMTTSNEDQSMPVEEEVNLRKTITYPSKDGLIITADTYIIDDTSDFMVLFHQAELSRGEYLEAALKFNELGYNVIAVDQRSGMAVNDIINETAKRAREGNYPNSWLDAGMDVQASIEYVRDTYDCDSMYLVGSSYSASLVLAIAPEYEDLLKGIITFSAAERVRWNDMKVKDHIKDLKVPNFMTSKKKEKLIVDDLFQHLTCDIKIQFVPEGYGKHGAIALWESSKDHEAYWQALIDFLELTKKDS